MLQDFSSTTIITAHAARTAETGPYPDACEAVLSRADMETAWDEITTWPGYAPTPLISLEALADELGLGAIHYKDEGPRFGLGSFKALGGSYAVLSFVADRIEQTSGVRPALADIRKGALADAVREITVTTATDGNHGRSVAWGAQMAGCRCRIYIHAEVSQGRQAAMEALGAEVIRVDGDYDESLRQCVEDAAANNWQIISDTSFEGYMDVPRKVMAGYGVFAREILDTLGDQLPTHVFVQAGVGGVAAAVLARFWQALGERRPRFVVVEPDRAACVLESVRLDRPAKVDIVEETIMAGLSCGEISLIAWEILSRGASDFLSIGEESIAPAMRLLAAGTAGGGRIVAGESAVPGLCGVIGAANTPALREKIGLGPDSRVLTIGCEGATDPEIYRRIVGDLPE